MVFTVLSLRLEESKTWMEAMVANSPKPAETGNPQVYSLQIARDWLEREGGRARTPNALLALLDATETALVRGEPPPTKDSVTLAELWRLSREGTDTAQVQPLRGSEVSRWWTARENHLRQICFDRGCSELPRLVVQTGGGRNLPTQFSFEFVALEEPALEPTDETEQETDGGIKYRIDSARPALWLRMLVGSRPFPIQSWRGYILLGSAVINFLLIGLIWIYLHWSWSQDRPVSTEDFGNFAIAILVSALLWILTAPVRLLPMQRVTLASPAFLALSELYGQLRTMPDRSRKGASRVFSVVRHWGVCPVCAADVDLDDGGKAFPNRLIGRCHDAPLEHVFSFDPVLLVGEPLRFPTNSLPD